MITNQFNRYSYQELRAAAIAPEAQQIDVDTLGEWFRLYGGTSWNGEYYDADDGLRLYEIVAWDDETDQGEVTGYEFR